jgi:hypothetical protein
LMVGCLMIAQGGCGGETAAAPAYTCGYLRHTAGAFRQQARVLVSREGLRAGRLFREEAVLDAEFRIRRVCDGAADGERPYTRAAALGSAQWLSPASAR